MKYSLLLLIILQSIQIQSTDTRDFPAIILTDPKLKLVDGWIMDGNQFKKNMKFRLELNKRRFGEKTPAGIVGFYEFENAKHSLQSLIALENELVIANTPLAQKQLQNLHAFLKSVIIEEFVTLSAPFLADARGAKKDIFDLILEWAHKAQRQGSNLLDWGASKEGEETQVVRTKIKTIAEFEQFYADLVYFLESLMRSCPVATAQFKELLKKEQAHLQAQK